MIDVQLLTDMYYAAPELWYLLAGAVLALVTVIVWEAVKILRLRQKNYFLNRDRERYAETLYASRDGYLSGRKSQRPEKKYSGTLFASIGGYDEPARRHQKQF